MHTDYTTDPHEIALVFLLRNDTRKISLTTRASTTTYHHYQYHNVYVLTFDSPEIVLKRLTNQIQPLEKTGCYLAVIWLYWL